MLLALAGLFAGDKAARAEDSGDKPGRAPEGDKAAAVELFKRGRQLMQAQKYVEACPLFAESLRLDPSGGTLLNLAFCYEHDNRTATAWAYYNDLLARSRREGRTERLRFARERLAILEPKLSRWTLVMGQNDKLVGVEVLRDGQVVPQALWGSPHLVDPGQHKIEVRAPDYKTWEGSFRAVVGQSATTEVPPLESQPSEAPTPSAAQPPPALVIESPHARSPLAEPPRQRPGSSAGRTTAGAVLGGVGVLGLGLGTYFGLTAFGRRDDAKRFCENGCSGEARERADDSNSSGKLYAHLSTASFGVGVVGVGLGAYFLFVSPGPSPKANALTSITPLVGPGNAGLSLTRAW